MTVQMTVIGLNQIGVSFGLALAKNKELVYRVGNDREPEVARKAQQMGAFDRVIYNLPASVENADMVVLALPVDEIQDTLKVIAPSLKPGCVVMDTSTVRGAVHQWMQELLPEDRYFVSLMPSLNPAYLEENLADVTTAHDDLFKKGVMVISSLPNTDPDAIKLAADLAALLGATPYFSDPLEADGLVASSIFLPRLVSAALLESAVSQPGWREARKLAHRDFARTTSSVENFSGAKSIGSEILLNKDNIVRMLDATMETLHSLREMIAEGDEKKLHKWINKARSDRDLWIRQRANADWEIQMQQPMPTMGDILGRLVGIRPKYDRKKKEQTD